MTKTKRTCGLDQRWLHIYLDGDFAPAEERIIETHVARCADCQRELAWLRATESVLTTVETPAPPADFTARLMARAAAEGALIQPKVDRSRWASIRRVARQATAGFWYAGQVLPKVSVPESWRDRAGVALGRGAATTGRGAWRASRWLLRRQRRPEPEPKRGRFSLPRLPGLQLARQLGR